MSLFQKDLKIHAEIEENVLMEKIYNNLKAFDLKMFEHISESENLLHENELGIIVQCINCKKIALL